MLVETRLARELLKDAFAIVRRYRVMARVQNPEGGVSAPKLFN